MDDKSRALFDKACQLIPGGVNSPVRACHNVDSLPLFIAEAHGSHIIDVDGREYIDFILSWGPMILGHDHPAVTAAVREAAGRGTSYGAPCPDEVTLAEEVVADMPSLEMVRMVNSGTEATMSALRLARGVTGRDKVLKFVGCYHGHADPFLAAAGSGLATFSIPGTPGVPAAVVADTLLAPYNDLEAVREIFRQHGEGIAAIIVEPVAANMGLVLPKPGFLEGLREITRQYGALLIFDEVITGFRASFGGAQARFGIDPDLTTFGKIIGGGMPVGAYAGSRALMEQVAPTGPVYQAGTLSGNPVAMAAGLAQLNIITDHPEIYTVMATSASYIANHLRASAEKHGIARLCLDHKTFPDRESYDRRVVEELLAAGVDTVALAGYMRLVTSAFLDAFPNRVLNVHPAVLPAFPGTHGARDAWEYGAKFSGCTVHVVDPVMDGGPIIIQATLPVRQEENDEELLNRIHVFEHRIYVQALEWLAEGRLHLEGRRMLLEPASRPLAPRPAHSARFSAPDTAAPQPEVLYESFPTFCFVRPCILPVRLHGPCCGRRPQDRTPHSRDRGIRRQRRHRRHAVLPPAEQDQQRQSRQPRP